MYVLCVLVVMCVSCLFFQLGGLIDEAGDDVELYMLNKHDQQHDQQQDQQPSQDDDNTSADQYQYQRPRSKRLKKQALQGAGSLSELGDTRYRDEFGYLAPRDLVPADLVVGVRVAKAKRGYMVTGAIIQVHVATEGGEAAVSSLASASVSLSSSSDDGRGNMRWEVRFDDTPESEWLSWDEIWYVHKLFICIVIYIILYLSVYYYV
jgi:hypothetical protein